MVILEVVVNSLEVGALLVVEAILSLVLTQMDFSLVRKQEVVASMVDQDLFLMVVAFIVNPSYLLLYLVRLTLEVLNLLLVTSMEVVAYLLLSKLEFLFPWVVPEVKQFLLLFFLQVNLAVPLHSW